MAKTVCVVLRKPPYGSLDAAEAIRHLQGALANGLCPVGLLLDDGVYLAKAGQQASGGWTDLSAALADLMRQTAGDPGGETRQAGVYAHEPSLRARGLTLSDLVPGIRPVPDSDAAALLAQADATLVY